MAVELATGYVSILPSAAGFGPKLASELAGIGVTVGAGLGDDVALGLAEGLKRNGAKVANAGKALSLGVTVPLAALGVAAVSAEADFSKSMNLLQAATGAPAEKMSTLRNLAKQLGKDTVFSAGEAARAMLELAKGGMTTAQIEAGGVQAAMTLAAAGEMEMADAAKVTMAAMNTFGLRAADAAEITDALAGAANASAADVDDLAQGLAMAGQAAAASGLTVQETTAALAAFSNAGLSGSDAGTSFKTMLTALNPKSKEAAELMGQLGLDFFDAQGNMKPLTGIAAELQSGFKGLSVEERNAALQTIFGSDASRAANILRKEGVKGITDLIAKTSEQGAAQKMADAAMKGTAGALEQLKGSLETAALAIGEALAPVVQDLAGKIRGLADWFTNLNPGVQETIVKIGLAAAAAGPLLFVFGKLGQSLGVIISLVTSAPAKWLAMKAAMVAVKVATAAWTAAQWLLNAALNANPIGLVILAIAALAAAIIWLWNNNEDFRNFVIAAWEKIREVVSAVVDWFKANVAPVLAAIWEKVSAALSVLWDVYKAVWGKIFSVVWEVVKWLAEKAWPIISWVWERIAEGAKITWTILKRVWDGIYNVIKPVADWIANTVAPWVVDAWEDISLALRILHQQFTTVWGGIADVVRSVVSWIVDHAGRQFTIMREALTTIWNAISSTVSTVWNAIKSTVDTAVDKVKIAINGISDVKDNVIGVFIAIKDGIDQRLQSLKEIVSGAVDRVKEILRTVSEVKDNVIGVFIAIRDGIAEKLDRAKEVVSAAVDRVKEFLRGIGDVKDNVIGFFTSMKDGIAEKLGNAIDFVKEIPGKIKDVFANVGNILVNAGKAIIQGLINGLQSLADAAYKKAREILQAIRDLFPGSPAKEGPFSGRGWVFYSGQAIVLSLADGITSAEDKAIAAARSAMTAVNGEMSASQFDTTLTPSAVAGYRPGMTTATINPNAYSGGPSNTFTITAAPTVPTEQQILTALARAEALQP